MSSKYFYENDTITINGRTITDFAAGDVVATLSQPNAQFSRDYNRNGDIIVARNANSIEATLILNVLAGSDDDVYLRGLKDTQKRSFTFYDGTLRQYQNLNGKSVPVNYKIEGITFEGDIRSPQSGNGSQISVYTLKGVIRD
jgi:hypothetical protein